MHLLEDSFDKGLWDVSGSVIFAIPPVYVVWNLLLGSSINLAILMQCLSDCCKAFMSVNLTSHNRQQSLPTSNLGFIYRDILIIQWVIVPFSWPQRVARINSPLPHSYDQVYAPPECFYLEALGTICLV